MKKKEHKACINQCLGGHLTLFINFSQFFNPLTQLSQMSILVGKYY